jgi:hypothetical protein
MSNMNPAGVGNRPLNVLIVLAGNDLDVAPILPALQPHYALVCTSPQQAIGATRQFEPDVALIDLRVSDVGELVRDLTQAAGGRDITFVAMPISAGIPSAPPLGFRFGLPLPATAGELDHLLWQIGRDRAVRTPLPGVQPDSGMIG